MSLKPMNYNPNEWKPQRVKIKENTSQPMKKNWSLDDFFDDDVNVDYEWRTEEDKTKQIGGINIDIYKMSYKEFQCYIYNQLEEVKSILNCIYDVVKEGEK